MKPRTLAAFIAGALLATGSTALGFGAPWSDYTEGPRKCAINDTSTQQTTIVRLGQPTRVVGYSLQGGAPVYDSPVNRRVSQWVAAQGGLSLAHRCW